ncbi:hypothetical protein PGB90_008880 [Kerria lacca]
MILKNLVALVTGGASGLGKATVKKLISEGNKVVLCDLPSSAGAEIAVEYQDDCVFVPTDVSSENDVSNALSITKEKFGKLNVVVNCAGTSVAFKTYNFVSKRPHALDDFVRILTVNTVGTFNVIRLAVALIGENQLNEENEKGVIINTASFAAYDGHQGQIAYAASKAAIAGMTLPLARDLGTEGIRVCAIAPGLFDTPLLSAIPEKVRIFFSRLAISPQRMGKPEEFAMLVQHIIENPFLNGTVIRLDAGLRMI